MYIIVGFYKNGKTELKDIVLPVYSNEPYAIYGISHITISKENLILKVIIILIKKIS